MQSDAVATKRLTVACSATDHLIANEALYQTFDLPPRSLLVHDRTADPLGINETLNRTRMLETRRIRAQRRLEYILKKSDELAQLQRVSSTQEAF